MSSSRSRRRRQASPAELAKWFALANERQEGALGQLLALYRPFLLKIAQRRVAATLRSKVGASDLVQSTILNAAKRFHVQTFESRKRFQAWLVAILENEARSVRRRFLRADKRDVTREQPLFGADTNQWLTRLSAKLSALEPARAVQLEWREVIQAALLRLPPHYQYVLHMRFSKDKDFGAIAGELNQSYDGVRMLCHRALVRLRSDIEARLRRGDAPEDQNRQPRSR